MVNVLMNEKYTNGVPTVENLRKQGYKVRVYHVRQYKHNGLQQPRMCSRKEFVGNFHEWVDSYGGRTVIELTCPDGKYTSVGKYNHGNGHNKQFNRKIGLQAAIGRALRNMNMVKNACGSESCYIERC